LRSFVCDLCCGQTSNPRPPTKSAWVISPLHLMLWAYRCTTTLQEATNWVKTTEIPRHSHRQQLDDHQTWHRSFSLVWTQSTARYHLQQQSKSALWQTSLMSATCIRESTSCTPQHYSYVIFVIVINKVTLFHFSKYNKIKNMWLL